jgi:hypothetical protein
MIYKTFKEWKDGNYLEDLEPRKEAYTRDELLLVEMGWKYGFDAGVEAGRKDENEAAIEDARTVGGEAGAEMETLIRARREQ